MGQLALIGFAAGYLSMWIFRKIGRMDRIATSLKQIQARLMEFWLYVDEPSLIWSSWKGLLKANAVLLYNLILPIAVLAIPTTALFYYLHNSYAYAPLRPGSPAVVTVHSNQPPTLQASASVAIESQPISVHPDEVSWRIRPSAPVTGNLTFTIGNRKIEKSVTAVHRLTLFGLLNWIEIDYPPNPSSQWYIWLTLTFLLGAWFGR